MSTSLRLFESIGGMSLVEMNGGKPRLLLTLHNSSLTKSLAIHSSGQEIHLLTVKRCLDSEPNHPRKYLTKGVRKSTKHQFRITST